MECVYNLVDEWIQNPELFLIIIMAILVLSLGVMLIFEHSFS